MHRLVLVLLIALLPLRMWAADGMAVSMGVQAATAGAVAAEALEGMPADCPMRLAAQDDDAPADPDIRAAACLSCQLCGALAVQAAFAAPSPSASPAPSPHAVTPHFDSADPLRERKPPIA